LLLSKCYNYSQRFKLTTELGEGTKLWKFFWLNWKKIGTIKLKTIIFL
jgi:hypothetical protein